MRLSSHHQARLLLAILRRSWDEAAALAAREPADPHTFPALCRACDIHPWIHALLTEHERVALVGGGIIEDLRAMRNKVRRDNLLVLARAEQALDCLLSAGVRPVALKGADLLNRIYTSFDRRTIDDIDLLLHAEELPAAVAALEKAGWRAPPEPKRSAYVRSSHHMPIESPGPLPVILEIHWNLVQEDRFRVDVSGLLERARPLEVGDRTVRRLEDHDLVAHLLVHHFTHYFDWRLKWLVDMECLVGLPGFDWDRVASLVRNWNAATAVGFSLIHLARLFPGLIPRRILERLRVATWRRLLTLPLHSSHPLDLFRSTRNRRVQLYLAAVMLERPWSLPGWMIHRATREGRRSEHPLDRAEGGETT